MRYSLLAQTKSTEQVGELAIRIAERNIFELDLYSLGTGCT